MVLYDMTEIRFYHLQRSSLKQTLPSLLEKIIERDMRVVLYLPDSKQVKEIDQWLWSYKPESFLPHGCDGDPVPAEHPIWITSTQSNPNNADVLIVTDAAEWQGSMDKIKIRCEIFDGNDKNILSKSRHNWKEFSAQKYDLSYWQQDQQGRWIKKES